jgi:uncharacterized membrane protein YhaH (DUF805 family)
MENEGAEGLVGLIIIAVWVLVFIVPAAKVLRRVGFSGWWSILAVVPLVGIIAFWIFAFVRWPIDKAANPLATGR